MYTENDLEKAQEIIREEKISKLISDEHDFEHMYIVNGNKDDYLVIHPIFCSCEHFVLRCIKEKNQICKHILAVQLSGENIKQSPTENWYDLILRNR